MHDHANTFVGCHTTSNPTIINARSEAKTYGYSSVLSALLSITLGKIPKLFDAPQLVALHLLQQGGRNNIQFTQAPPQLYSKRIASI
jgi:hypothetical protein